MTERIDQDPVFAAIERHRELSVLADEAAAISTKFVGVSPESEAASEITSERSDDVDECAHALIRLEPTTMAGAIALTRYVAGIREWQMPTDCPEWEESAPDVSCDWRRQVFLTTLANALDKISAGAADGG